MSVKLLERLMIDVRMRGNYSSQSIKAFRESAEVVKTYLQRAGVFSGAFFLIPKEKRRWKINQNNVLCIRPSQGHEIRIRVRTNDSDQTWEYSLTPATKSVCLDSVRGMLETVVGGEFVEDGNETIEHTAPEAAPLRCIPKVIEEVELIVTKPAPAAVPSVLPPAPETPINLIAQLDQLRDALLRRDERAADLKRANEVLARIERQIADLQKTREEQQMEILSLEESIANDKAAKAAEQFAELLARLKV